MHIGGHIAFDSEAIAALCRARGVTLLEDCAHAHGATWDGRRAGSYGDAGIYSLYATKTISTGEGGVLVSRDPELLAFARAFRNYGKPDHEVTGLACVVVPDVQAAFAALAIPSARLWPPRRAPSRLALPPSARRCRCCAT